MKERLTDFFRREDVMVLITTSPTGLGHIRVTESLISGLPKGMRVEVMGIESGRVQFIHRLTSRNNFLRIIAEFIQNNSLLESLFTGIYRLSFRIDSQDVYRQISDLVKRRRPKPEVLLIVSTHFTLAHTIAELEKKLVKELKLCVMLCVVVTDDSPQKLWGVAGADYIFVPSRQTQKSLTDYLSSQKPPLPKVLVSPYPVSLKFSGVLSEEEIMKRKMQLKPKSEEKLKILIPISGAGAQLGYFKKLLTYLDAKGQAEVTLVSRDSNYTKKFINWCQDVQSVEVIADRRDREVVASYEQEIEKGNFAIEITKPSEQAYKALLKPNQRGGMVMLFSGPIGRQEHDNLNFLLRHGLIPNSEDQKTLNKLFYSDKPVKVDQAFLDRAKAWRGLLLPTDGLIAGRAILRLKKTGILYSMVNFNGFEKSRELKSNGVRLFWRKLAKHTKNQCTFLP